MAYVSLYTVFRRLGGGLGASGLKNARAQHGREPGWAATGWARVGLGAAGAERGSLLAGALPLPGIEDAAAISGGVRGFGLLLVGL